jgi:ribokinase
LVRAVVIGAVNWDVTLFVRKLPRAGAEIAVEHLTRVPGGKAGNVAVATARLLGPNQAAILGGVGKDSIASEQVRIFHEEGVITTGLKVTDDSESGQAYIIVDNQGENLIHTYIGANASMAPEDLDNPSRSKLISAASIIAIMDPPFETALKLAKESKQLGKIVTWDPGMRSELGIKTVGTLLENVDYLSLNESESANLTGTRNIREGSRGLIKVNPGLKVVTKLGAKGCILHQAMKTIKSRPFDLRFHGLKVVNTVGCGDAFLGALVASLSEGRSDDEALEWANCAAGLKATKLETRGSPDRMTLLKYLS